MTDLDSLESLIGKYVVIEENGDGLAGWVETVGDIMFRAGQQGREIWADYGMGWFVTQSTLVQEGAPPSMPENI